LIFLFALDVVAVLAFAFFLAALLKPPTRVSFLVGLFVLAWADVVLVAEALSLLRFVTAWGFAAGHVVLAAGALAAWISRGRPRPGILARPAPGAAAASLRSWPDLWALGATVGLAYAFQAAVILLVPPNNPDSMVYHLAKVGHWIQNKSLAPWMTPCLHQTIYPFNVEIGSLWSMVFLHRDLLAGFVQWTAAGAAMVSIFGLARLLGFARPRALFASLVFLTLPMIALQATTTQTDLTVGAMAAAAVFLLLLGVRTSHRGMLALSGAALGLLVGMKLTTLIILPGLGIGLLYVTLTRRPRSVRPFLFWAGAGLAGFVVLGAFNYVQAWLFTRHFDWSLVNQKISSPAPPGGDADAGRAAGPAKESAYGPTAIESATKGPSLTRTEAQDESEEKDQASGGGNVLDRGNLQISARRHFRLEQARNNIARDIYAFADATGLPPSVAVPLVNARAGAGRFVFALLRLRTKASDERGFYLPFTFREPKPLASEAGAFFGPLGFFLILPALLYGLIAGLARRDMRSVLALAFLGFMVLMAGGTSWQPFRGRYYCAVIPLVMPLTAAVFGRGPFRVLLRGMIAVLAATVMIFTVLTNVQKPLIGPDAIWNKTFQERRVLESRRLGFPLKAVEEEIPPGAVVAAVLRSTNPEYLLFGPSLGRRVVPVFPRPEVIDGDWLDTQPYDYLMVNVNVPTRLKRPVPPGYRLVFHYPYAIIVRGTEPGRPLPFP
jgi:4-amino-4-deoxy-L-arabinose transferase-like glycosyltransferase